jgi:hypothetical protein
MGNKFSLILAMGLFLQVVLISADLIAFQLKLSQSYILVNTINNYIIKRGAIDNELQDYVYSIIGIYITCVISCSASSGQALSYELAFSYEPVIKFIKGNSSNFIIRQKAYVE